MICTILFSWDSLNTWTIVFSGQNQREVRNLVVVRAVLQTRLS